VEQEVAARGTATLEVGGSDAVGAEVADKVLLLCRPPAAALRAE